MSGYYIVSLFCIMAVFLPIYCLARIIWVRKRKANRSVSREVVMGAFVIFMFGLLFLTFQDNGISWMKADTPGKAWERVQNGIGVNLVPFRTIGNYFKYASGTDRMAVNILGNILMFVPWGLGLPLLWRKFQSVFKVAFASLMLPVFIEFVQLFIGRSVDIDDVILNLAGGILGGLIYLMIKKFAPKTDVLAG